MRKRPRASHVRAVGVAAARGASLRIEAAIIGRASKHVKGLSRLQGGNTRYLPAAKNFAIPPVVPAENAMPRTCRQLHHVDKHRSVANIEAGRSALEPQVVAVGRQIIFPRSYWVGVIVDRFA